MFEKLLSKQHIRDLDLTLVRATLIQKLGWMPEKALRMEVEYKRFLYALAHKGKDDIISPPMQEVDEFWHQHILFTRKYREDCQKIFGHYVDHTPGLSPEKQRQADACRMKVYQDYEVNALFIDYNPAPQSSHNLRSKSDSGISACSSGCGSGSSTHDSHGNHHSVVSHTDASHHSSDSGGHGHSDGGDSSSSDSGSGDSGGDSGGADGGGCGSGCSGGCGGG